jgi:hypothetical protein
MKKTTGVPMGKIRRIHDVMRANFYVHNKVTCTYDTRYASRMTEDGSTFKLEILNDKGLEVSKFLTAAGIPNTADDRFIFINLIT